MEKSGNSSYLVLPLKASFVEILVENIGRKTPIFQTAQFLELLGGAKVLPKSSTV